MPIVKNAEAVNEKLIGLITWAIIELDHKHAARRLPDVRKALKQALDHALRGDLQAQVRTASIARIMQVCGEGKEPIFL